MIFQTGKKYSPLHAAAQAGHAETVRHLLSRKDASIDETGPDGKTALHHASREGHVEVVRILLEAGADAGARDADGWTPLHEAAQNGGDSVIALLVAKGADVEAMSDRPALRPLQAAAEAGQLLAVLQLLGDGAQKDAASGDRAAPLHLAVSNGHFAVALELAKAGCRIEGDGEARESALDILARRLAGGQHAQDPDISRLAWRLVEGASLLPAEVLNALRQGAPDRIAPDRPQAGGNMAPDITPPGQRDVFHYRWENAPPHITQLIVALDKIGDKYPVSASTTVIRIADLPWYDAVRIVQVKDPAWETPNLFVYFLIDGQQNLYRLDGTSPPIHEVNARAPIRLNQANVLNYLWFFCYFVRGVEGPFLLAETVEDTFVPKNIDAATRTVIESTLRPAMLLSADADGSFQCDGVVYYSNALFIANFRVLPSGMVEMQGDEPIAADLPVKIDSPVA